MERQAQLGSPWGVFADQTESLEESLFASACCWVWLCPLVPFFFQPEIKGNMRMTGQRWKKEKTVFHGKNKLIVIPVLNLIPSKIVYLLSSFS